MKASKCLDITRLTQIGLLAMIIALAIAALYPVLNLPTKEPQSDRPKPDPMPEYIGARLGIANYVNDELATVFIDKQWAGNAQPMSSTSGTCCVELPTQWKPGMKMLISWRSASMYAKERKPRLAEREVEVLPYAPFHDGYVWAIFLPNGQIRVQPSPTGPGGAGFINDLPYPIYSTPEELKKFINDTMPHKAS